MNLVLAILDVLGGLAMVELMKATTPNWTLKTVQGRWSFLRRLVYGAVAVALFANGLIRLDNPPINESFGFDLTQLVILFAIILFPTLRAFGLVSQDKWRNGSTL